MPFVTTHETICLYAHYITILDFIFFFFSLSSALYWIYYRKEQWSCYFL